MGGREDERTQLGQDRRRKNKKHSIDLENNCLIVICCWAEHTEGAEGPGWVVDSLPIALTGLAKPKAVFLWHTTSAPKKLFEVRSDITAALSAETKLKLELQ